MTKRLINPELDELVRQMNRVDGHDEVVEGEDPSASGLDPPSIRDVQGDEPLERLLVEMVQRKASDLLLIPGAPPVLRINGELVDPKSLHTIRKGDQVLLRTPGGGGYGKESERDAGLVELDTVRGLI